MKKPIILVLAALLALPVSGIAQNMPKIKSVDLTLEVPAPGMSMYDAQEMQFTSAKTEFGDLAPTGGIQVYSLDWVGDFREVWLSDKVDAAAFVRSMYTQMQANFDPETKVFAPGYSFLFYSRRATLFVPEESVGKVLEVFTGPRSTDYMTFTLKAYSGDVYSAQKKGADTTPAAMHGNTTIHAASAGRMSAIRSMCSTGAASLTTFSCISMTGLSPMLRPMWG